MFFSIFWTAYIPVTLLILSLLSQGLLDFVSQTRAGQFSARPASGHEAIAPPISVMNSRRVLIRSPRRREQAAWRALRGRAPQQASC
jgi:hypothetical protein